MKGLRPLLDEDLGYLAPFVDAGVLDSAAVHVARLVARTVPAADREVVLAAALATRAPGFGHVCVVIDSIARSVIVDDAASGAIESLPWPDPERWARLLAGSAGVRNAGQAVGETIAPLVFDGSRLYLERYWRFEERVAHELSGRGGRGGGLAASRPLEAVLEESFAGADPVQKDAARNVLSNRLTVIGGGPGTGKTTTVSRLLVAAFSLALARGERLEVALAAPTGKAATRMETAVHEAAEGPKLDRAVAEALVGVKARTLHRLLGIAVAGSPRYDAKNRLPHDLVVVDETSMVSLPLMARLLEAVRPEATLVLVGDPFQLASVEAGAVLGDIVGPVASRGAHGPLEDNIVLLEQNHRFDTSPVIAALATAIREGEADLVVEILADNCYSARDWSSSELAWLDPEKGDPSGLAHLQQVVADQAAEVVEAASRNQVEEGLELASELKVLCATRFGPVGVAGWTSAIEARLKPRFAYGAIGGRNYPGRPVIVTRNDYMHEVFNGDVGLVVSGPAGLTTAFRQADGRLRTLALSQLDALDTWWATTIHKSQGSEHKGVVISLPAAPSPVLTRELLYTAVTRARQHVTLFASESSIRAAVSNPVARASGLGPKLWPGLRDGELPAPAPPRPAPGKELQLRFDL